MLHVNQKPLHSHHSIQTLKLLAKNWFSIFIFWVFAPYKKDTPYSAGTSMAPLLTSSIMSCAGLPSTVQPTLWAVPKISFVVPLSSRAIDRGRIVRAIVSTSSNVMLPLCLTVNKKTHFHNINLEEWSIIKSDWDTHCFSPSFGLVAVLSKL